MTDTIKTAADFLRQDLAIMGYKVGSSHAHAAIAGYCGYNSKKALLDSQYIDPEDESLLLKIEPNIAKLTEVIGKMKSTPLQSKSLPIEHIARSIRAGLTPPCECCQRKKHDVQPIGDPYEYGDEPDGWVSLSCAESDEDYATCIYCGPEIIFRADQINEQGECPEHNGESYMDEEESQGWQDLIEYWNKDQ